MSPDRPQSLAERGAPYAEVLAALGATLGLTVALAAGVLLPLMLALGLPPLTAEVPLAPRPGASRVVEPLELVAALSEQRIAGRVAVVDTAAGEWLVLTGIESRVAAERSVLLALASSGFEPPARFHTYRDATALVEDMRVTVPLLLVQAAAFGLAGLLLIRMRVPPSPAGAAVGRAVAVGVGFGVAAVAVGSALGWTLELIGMPVSEQEVLARLLADPARLLLLSPLIVVAAPLAEELFFRGYVFRFLTAKQGLTAGLAVSSLLFAVVHLNFTGLPVYIGVGTLFALAYRRTSSMVAPVAAHVTYNGILLMVLGLGS